MLQTQSSVTWEGGGSDTGVYRRPQGSQAPCEITVQLHQAREIVAHCPAIAS